MTEVLRVDPARPDPAVIARAASCLAQGGLVAFPTETVYGLGVHALDRDAVLRLFAAKGRPANDPLIVHVLDQTQLAALTAAIPRFVPALAARFWPGPLTLVLPRSGRVPDEVTAGLDTVAVRVPAHPVARAVLAAAAIPIAAPSANLFSRPSPTRADHVLQDLDGRIDLIIDGGATTVGLESTVVDATGGRLLILRPGAVTREMLREIDPQAEYAGHDATGPQDAMRSPGLLSRHYAPRTPLTLYRGDPARVAAAVEAARRAAITKGQRVRILSGSDLEAPRLYAALREIDAQGVDAIFACDPGGDEGLSQAIRDRLRRAATTIVDVD